MSHILVVEDDSALQDALLDILSREGYACECANNGQQALQSIKKSLPALVLSDIRMDTMDGFKMLEIIRSNYPGVPVIMMTAYVDIDDAVGLMRSGAIDYLAKPFEKKDLLERVARYIKAPCQQQAPVIADRQSHHLLRIAQKVAASDASVLITGESGTGKEVLARYIHDHSPRASQPFVAINCAAIPEQMLEATLFGYEKGAFTGAYKAMPGKFEQAEGGTLLLDEVTEMSPDLQAKFLRVLQEREIERIGGQKTISINVRIISTSNRSLQQQIQSGHFREDLYFRLNVFPLQWPPLRQRKDDILPLARYLITKHCRFKNEKPQLGLSAEQALMEYHWPGNARELDNAIQRALVLKPQGILEAVHLGLAEGELNALQWMQELCEGIDR